MGRLIAIGDIHGCADALTTVLHAIAPQADDTIVTLGDYIDRGPDSRRVIDSILSLRSRCKVVSLVGNHEVLMQSARNSDGFDFWLGCGGRETLASYGGQLDAVPDDHWQFIDECRLWFETDDYFFVHANYTPDLPLHEQEEATLLWMHLTYGIPLPHINRKTAFVGHTPQPNRKIGDWGYLVCIDTCCFGGGCLTACDVETRQLWQADIHGNLLGE